MSNSSAKHRYMCDHTPMYKLVEEVQFKDSFAINLITV